MNGKEQIDKKLTINEASEYLDVSHNALYGMIRRNYVNAEKTQNKYKKEWRFSEKELDRVYKKGHIRAFCFSCKNQESAFVCSIYKNINDPIVDEDGHCISKM